MQIRAVTLAHFSDSKWLDLGDLWTVPLAIGLMVIVSKLTSREIPADVRMKMLVLHAPEKLGLKQEYIQEHAGH